MAFSKKRVEDRKQWLGQFQPGKFVFKYVVLWHYIVLIIYIGTFMDYSVGRVSFSSFVNQELILFSREDNERSIPSMVDGLKPGQRKVCDASYAYPFASVLDLVIYLILCVFRFFFLASSGTLKEKSR